jgi:hypothetical protein
MAPILMIKRMMKNIVPPMNFYDLYLNKSLPICIKNSKRIFSLTVELLFVNLISRLG